MFRRFAFACFLMPILSAEASTVYRVEEGGWTIKNGSTKCFAVNRPLAEVGGVSPNVMVILEDKSRNIEISVTFWPGALPEKIDTITFTLWRNEPVLVPAMVTNVKNGSMITTAPLSNEFLLMLKGHGPLTSMTAEVPGTKAKLNFDASYISRVLIKLSNCVLDLD